MDANGSTERTPEPVLASAGAGAGSGSAHSELVDYVGKRVRNLQKRKQKLDKLQEIKDADPTRLNADQLATLQDKEMVEQMLREHGEVLKAHAREQAAHEAEIQRLEAAHAAALDEARAQAAAEGARAEREKLALTLKCLRAISYKRSLPQTSEAETAGLEKMLQVLYHGEDESLDEVDRLFAGEDAPVTEGAITYREVREIALSPVESFFQAAQAESSEQEPQDHDAESRPSGRSGPSGGFSISFLQEEVLDDEPEQEEEQPQPAGHEAVAEAAQPTEATQAIQEATQPAQPNDQPADSAPPKSTKPDRRSNKTKADSKAESKPDDGKKKKFHRKKPRANGSGKSSPKQPVQTVN